MINICLCDDNLDSIKSVAKLLESELIEQELDAEITLITSDQDEVYNAVLANKIDILFMDIDFKNNGKNGIEFAKTLRKINKNFYLIFLSAHQRYMSISFTAKVFDYLVKPINSDVLQELVCRIKDEFKNANKLFLNLNRWDSIKINDILYIEKVGNKSVIITNEETYSTSKTLDNLLEELPNNFMKCHKSYLLNSDKVISIDKKNKYAYFTKDLKCSINSHFNL